MMFYVLVGMYTAILMLQYFKRNNNVDTSIIYKSGMAPGISILVPVYNEERSIVECIQSLSSLDYHDYEIIIINDGSEDSGLDKLKETFLLESIMIDFEKIIPTAKINQVYKSSSKEYGKITLIDKENGGKSDALNAGINLCKNELFLAIDADSLIAKDGLLKLIKPFLEYSEDNVIATGSVVRVANDCIINDGVLLKAKLSKKYLVQMQVLEYTRAFLMARFAWSKLGGLMVISGAIGLFKKSLVASVGGYSKTVGEDMELLVKVRRYLYELKIPFRVEFVPDPLCWTEVPSEQKELSYQRNRWMRGTIDTLIRHKKVLFNSRYKSMGFLGYPYWLLFEWLAPLVELFGILYFMYLIFTGSLNWPVFLIFFLFVYSYFILYSVWAILFEELTFHRYERKTEILKLILTAFLEPFFLHLINMLSSVKANWDYIFKPKNSWGEHARKGFGKYK
jgi:cellulose synthase/poly-beta-1,6-N-acetylglucosamine synthase-like glycosyltransferase